MNDMTFKIDLGPVLYFFQSAPSYLQNLVYNLDATQYYFIICWLLSLFVVPAQFKSLGSVVAAPAWLPFFLVAKVFNFVLAAKRGSNVSLMAENVSRAAVNLESVSAKLKENQTDLNDKLKSVDKLIAMMKDELNENILCLDDKLVDVKNKLDDVLVNVDDNLNAINDLREDVEVSQSESKPLDSKEDMSALSKDISNIKQLLRTYINALNTKIHSNVEKQEKSCSCKTTTPVSVSNNEDKSNGILQHLNDMQIFYKNLVNVYADYNDNFYVPIGHLVNDSGDFQYNGSSFNGYTFVFKFAVRLGALRKGKVESSDVLTINTPAQVDYTHSKIMPNGLPTFLTKADVEATKKIIDKSTFPINIPKQSFIGDSLKEGKKIESMNTSTVDLSKKKISELSDKELVSEIRKFLEGGI